MRDDQTKRLPGDAHVCICSTAHHRSARLDQCHLPDQRSGPKEPDHKLRCIRVGVWASLYPMNKKGCENEQMPKSRTENSTKKATPR